MRIFCNNVNKFENLDEMDDLLEKWKLLKNEYKI